MAAAYDYSKFHAGKTCEVFFVMGQNGVGVWIGCSMCRYIVNLDSLDRSVDPCSCSVDVASRERKA